MKLVNNNNTALDQMSDAVAHAVLLFSKRNFDKQPLVDPALAAAARFSGSSLPGVHPADFVGEER